MRFASLGSGSRGNATLVEAGQTCVLIDCGFSVKETRLRLQRLGRDLSDLDVVLVTHEHGDHFNGVGAVARASGAAVWMTPGTWHATGPARAGELPQLNTFNVHQHFVIDDLQVEPFPVPHDAREPCQFVLSDGQSRLGVLSDVGHSTPVIEEYLTGCDGLFIEFNHDRHMLLNGDYHETLKRRIDGNYGHLNNQQSAQILANIDTSRLRVLAAGHLSERHNRPELVRAVLADTLGCEADWVTVAGQEDGFRWREI